MKTKQTNKIKLNNEGASVIELIIIMTILAVMLSGSIIAFSLVNSGNIKQACRASQSYIEKTRTSAMSVMADEWSFVLKKDGEEYKARVYKTYTKDEDNSVTELIEERSLGSRVSATLICDTEEIDLNGKELKITFNQSTGGVDKVMLDTEQKTPVENIISIKFTSGKSNASCVKLYFVSGKVEIE